MKLSLDGTEDEEFDLQGHLLVGMPSWPDAMTDPKGLADKRQPDRTSA